MSWGLSVGEVVNKLLLSTYYMQTLSSYAFGLNLFESVTVLGSRMLLHGREGGQVTSYSWTSGKLLSLSLLIRKMGINNRSYLIGLLGGFVQSKTKSKQFMLAIVSC